MEILILVSLKSGTFPKNLKFSGHSIFDTIEIGNVEGEREEGTGFYKTIKIPLEIWGEKMKFIGEMQKYILVGKAASPDR